jgi:hypothetical protein
MLDNCNGIPIEVEMGRRIPNNSITSFIDESFCIIATGMVSDDTENEKIGEKSMAMMAPMDIPARKNGSHSIEYILLWLGQFIVLLQDHVTLSKKHPDLWGLNINS